MMLSIPPEDEKFFMELATNYDNVQRVEVAQRYKDFAWKYNWEAMLLYLEWKQEKHIKGACKKHPTTIVHKLFFGLGATLLTQARSPALLSQPAGFLC